MPHDHSHSHGHSHAPANFGRAFAIGVALNAIYVVSQVVFGLRAHSVALLADAGHNLSDVACLLVAWSASGLSKRPPTAKRSYGLGSTSILAAVVNAVVLLVAIGGIAWEALRRLSQLEPVQSNTVIIVAALGILINGATALLFMKGREHDLNIRGAFLHMAADAGISFGVVVAAFGIGLTGWLWLDPAASLAIVTVVVIGTWSLLRESLDLALQAVPAGTDLESIKGYLEGLEGVCGVHDLHIWALSTSTTALTAHLVMPERSSDDSFLAGVVQHLHDEFHIEHATIQVERGDVAHPCPLAPSAVV